LSTGLFIAVLLLVAAALILRKRHGLGRPPGVEPWMPRALWGAQLAWAEQTFRSQRRRLVARVDRAYRLDGQIVLVELKTRRANAVYESDVIELSAQRAALQDATGQPVSMNAWVLVESVATGWRTPLEVKLLNDEELATLMQRYRLLQKNQLDQAKPARRQSMCTQCGHRARCHAKYGDRR
jgi:CRISPR-associated exonuclease Cas4